MQVETDGASLFVQVQGAGDPILFIQGTATAGEAWRPQLDALSDSFTCATFDNRGMAQSAATGPITVPDMAADAIAVLDALGFDKAHVVGHSLGGLIAQEVALTAPQRVRSLVLSCTFARGSQATRLTPSALWNGLRTAIGTRAMRRKAFLVMLAPPDLQTPQTAERMAPLIGRDLADRPPVVMKQVGAMSRYDRFDDLAQIEAPTLVQSATDDPIALPAFGQQLAAAIPGARYVQLPGRHAHTLLDPQPFNDLLREHLAETSGAAVGPPGSPGHTETVP